MRRLAGLWVLAAFAGSGLYADFSYEQTSKLTGGMMAGMMKVVGVFSKQAREPIRTTVLVKGDRMANLSPTSGHIIDLAKETITEVDFQKKTYSVLTFAQMAEALKQLEARMKSEKGEQTDITVKASVKETGQSKQFSGLNARELLLTLELEGTDQKSNQRGAFMVVTGDLWLAPPAGYQEVRNFQQRMAQKLAWAPGTGMFSQGRSDIAKGMGDLYKEAAKLDGLPVFQVIKMGFKGEPGQQAAAPPAEQPRAQEPEKPSAGGALGRLGGRLGGLGGLGRRKQEQKEQPPQAQPAGEAAGAQGDTSGALMEMTTELTSFSTAPVDASRLEVPAGFRQVESELLKATRR